jgi:penicillin-binding protein 1A
MRVLVALASLAAGAAALGLLAFWWLIVRPLPAIDALEDYRPQVATRVLDASGTEIALFWKDQRRIVLPIEEIPRQTVEAFVSAEDGGFYDHQGLDYSGILRATLLNLLAGQFRQGGSTITQQLAKELLLTPERSMSRKLKDMWLAWRIEKNLGKTDILHLYLNQIYLGHYYGPPVYGIEAAARAYFAKSARELTLAESALLAGIVPAPSIYTPARRPELAKRRQGTVLDRMVRDGRITPAQREAAFAEPLAFAPREDDAARRAAQPFVAEVRSHLIERFGEEQVLTGGLVVKTTLDSAKQRAAWRAVRNGLIEHDRRRGYRGPLEHHDVSTWAAVIDELGAAPPVRAPEGRELVEALVVEVDEAGSRARLMLGPGDDFWLPLGEVAWAGARAGTTAVDAAGDPPRASRISQVFALGDRVRLERSAGDSGPRYALQQEPLAESALFSLDVETGHVQALVGGYDFRRSSFDRALQMKRQPGSSFKPIVYARALQERYTTATIVQDTPVVFTDRSGTSWKPENFSREFYGPMTLRAALAQSRNIPAIKVADDIGTQAVIELARRLGIESKLDPGLSLALGASEVTLAELTAAYAAFAAGGRRVDPVFVLEVRGPDGELLEENVPLIAHASEPPPGPALDPVTAYLITDMMRAVIEEGSGFRAKELGRPVAGKTGTTNQFLDAWFVGFSPGQATGVWVGYDKPDSMGRNETGSRAAAPIWVEYMREALRDDERREFEVPNGVIFARIDPQTGRAAPPSSKSAVFLPFREGTVPSDEPATQPNRALRD